MYKIEIWQNQNISEVYEADDIQDILAWYKWYWYESWDKGVCAFYVYKNGFEELEFNELYELGFY